MRVPLLKSAPFRARTTGFFAPVVTAREQAAGGCGERAVAEALALELRVDGDESVERCWRIAEWSRNKEVGEKLAEGHVLLLDHGQLAIQRLHGDVVLALHTSKGTKRKVVSRSLQIMLV